MRQGQVQSLFTLVYTGETPTCSPASSSAVVCCIPLTMSRDGLVASLFIVKSDADPHASKQRPSAVRLNGSTRWTDRANPHLSSPRRCQLLLQL